MRWQPLPIGCLADLWRKGNGKSAGTLRISDTAKNRAIFSHSTRELEGERREMRSVAGTLFVTTVLIGALNQAGHTAEPKWSPQVIATGADGRTIRSKPITRRPSRPLHFYGNTIRRAYHRGRPGPTVEDVTNSVRVFIRRTPVSSNP